MSYVPAPLETQPRRRAPRVDNEVQRLHAEIARLKLQMQQVVDEANAWRKAREEWTNEQIRLSQQAQVDADQKVIDEIRRAAEMEIRIARENFDIIYAENEQLQRRVAELEAKLARRDMAETVGTGKPKTRAKRKERRWREQTRIAVMEEE